MIGEQDIKHRFFFFFLYIYNESKELARLAIARPSTSGWGIRGIRAILRNYGPKWWLPPKFRFTGLRLDDYKVI